MVGVGAEAQVGVQATPSQTRSCQIRSDQGQWQGWQWKEKNRNWQGQVRSRSKSSQIRSDRITSAQITAPPRGKVRSDHVKSDQIRLGLFVPELTRKTPAFAFFLNRPCARPDSSKSANCWPEQLRLTLRDDTASARRAESSANQAESTRGKARIFRTRAHPQDTSLRYSSRLPLHAHQKREVS